jgi:hypothetical protein
MRNSKICFDKLFAIYCKNYLTVLAEVVLVSFDPDLFTELCKNNLRWGGVEGCVRIIQFDSTIFVYSPKPGSGYPSSCVVVFWCV